MCTSSKPNTNWGGKKVSQHCIYSELTGCDLRATLDRVTDSDMKSWVVFYNLQYSPNTSYVICITLKLLYVIGLYNCKQTWKLKYTKLIEWMDIRHVPRECCISICIFEKRSKVVPWGVFITFPTFSISFLESPPATDDIIMAERETKMTTYPYPPSLGTCPNIQ